MTNEKDQYAIIGEFVVKFEDINEWIRFIIPQILFPIPVKSKDSEDRNLGILLEGITASPLISKLDALISDNFKKYPRLIELNIQLSKKISELTNIRNTIVHGSYRLFWADFKGNISNDTLSITHEKVTKTGFEKRSKIYTIESIKKLIFQMTEVSKAYNFISAIIETINSLGIEHKNVQIYTDWLEEKIKSIEKIELPHLIVKN